MYKKSNLGPHSAVKEFCQSPPWEYVSTSSSNECNYLHLFFIFCFNKNILLLFFMASVRRHAIGSERPLQSLKGNFILLVLTNHGRFSNTDKGGRSYCHAYILL